MRCPVIIVQPEMSSQGQWRRTRSGELVRSIVRESRWDRAVRIVARPVRHARKPTRLCSLAWKQTKVSTTSINQHNQAYSPILIVHIKLPLMLEHILQQFLVIFPRSSEQPLICMKAPSAFTHESAVPDALDSYCGMRRLRLPWTLCDMRSEIKS